MSQPLHILHLEDSVDDSDLVRLLLQKDGLDCEIRRVETRAEFFDSLQKGRERFDIILADLRLPQFSGMDALEIARALNPEVPFVFVSGTIGEETAINSLRNGATDYVLKGQLARLAPAVRRALAEAEEKVLRRQLQQRLHEIARLEAIGTLSNGIAHDFNNALTIILGHASLLAAEHQNPRRVLEITGTITAAARRAAEVVQQLLAFAQKGNTRAVSIDINRHLRTTLNGLRTGLPSRVELAFEPAPGLPDLLVDVGQLDRVLHNLVSNAVESMPAGGRITVSTQLVSGREIPNFAPELAARAYVRVRVGDTGSGIDSTTREHIFEPFYTTKERGHGTGLGLPVAYGVMQAHHGWIHIDSEPGRGTSVLLFFPVTDAGLQNETGSEASPGAAAPTPHETILVVEDEEDVQSFLSTVLQNHGYRVRLAADHDQALDFFRQDMDGIRLVFSDYGLPRIDGITLCGELRKIRPSLKVILASGYSPREFQERLEHLRPDAFVAKPYTAQAVLDSIRQALHGTPAGASVSNSR